MTTPPQQPPPPPPPGGGGTPPAGYANSEEKTWALVSHFGGAAGVLVGCGLLGWVPPLIALLAKGNDSPTVRTHAVKALNFQITWAGISLLAWIVFACLGSILAVVTFGIGGVLWFVPALIALVPLIFGIIAGIKANEGQAYDYPVSMKLVK